VILFYSKMDGSKQDITDMLQSNQFSGKMVLALFGIIIIMVVDRIIYSTYSFEKQTHED
jgi:hypothetical protein